MTVSPIKVFSTARTWLISLSSVGLIVVSGYYSSNNGSFTKLMEMKNALQICSTRVGQTHTASVLGDSNSIYLDSGFTGSTEECFADLQSLAEENQILGKEGVKKANALGSNVHWFSESLRSSGSAFSVKETSTNKISDKFSNVESSVDSFSEAINVKASELEQVGFNLKVCLYLLGGVLILSGAYEIIQRRVFNRKKKEIESEALSELLSNDVTTAGKVEGIIKNALDLNEMGHCSKLITTYRENVFENMASKSESVDTRAVAFADKKLSHANELVNAVWEESEKMDQGNILSDDENSLLDNLEIVEEVFKTPIYEVAQRVRTHLSEKIHASSTMVELKLDQSEINSNEESLEQALYYLINDGIENLNHLSALDLERKVVVTGRSLGSIYNFTVESYGDGRKAEESTNFMIAQEISKDANGRIEASNLYSENKEIIGRKVRLILKSSKKAIVKTTNRESSLVRLERGTKKEILARMNA